MEKVTTIGLDIAKSVFQVHGIGVPDHRHRPNDQHRHRRTLSSHRSMLDGPPRCAGAPM